MRGDSFIDSKKLVSFIYDIAADKKAEDLVVLDMRKVSDLCDYFFICSANSTRQSKAIADEIIEKLKGSKKVSAWHVEGYKDGMWILLDYNLVVVHIFYHEVRAFYRLERLWGDAPSVDISKLNNIKNAKKSRRRKTIPPDPRVNKRA